MIPAAGHNKTKITLCAEKVHTRDKPILVIFGSDVAGKVSNKKVAYFSTSPN